MLSLTRRRNGLYLVAGLVFTFVLLSYRNLDRDGLPLRLRPGSGTEPTSGATDSPWRRQNTGSPVRPEGSRHPPPGRPRASPRAQKPSGAEPGTERSPRLIRQQRVKDAFLRCWNSYRANAWM